MPSEREMEKRFREINNYDLYYRTAVSGVAATLQSLAVSESFADEVGMDEADELNDLADNIRLSYAVLSTRQEYDKLRPRAFKRIYEVPGYLEQTYTDKKGNTCTYLDALIKAAAEHDGPKAEAGPEEAGKKPEVRTAGTEKLYDDLYLLDSKLHMGLKLPPLPREAAKHTQERSWKNYTLAHLYNVPHEPEKKEEYLSKAMVGAVMAARVQLGPKAEAKLFSLDRARDAAKTLRKLPAFKALCKDPYKVRNLLAKGKKDPGLLAEAVDQMQRPFSRCSDAECRRILEKLQSMEPMMDGPDGRSEKWRRFRNSIRTIDLNDPANSGKTKLQEILDNTVDYTKGKKSLRRNEEDQNCFDQSLDVLAILAEGGEYAQLTAQAVVDRTNEVRLGHDADYDPINLKQYGLAHIAVHTNVADERQIRDYEKSFLKPKGTLKRNVFEVRRGDDPSELVPVPRNLKGGAATMLDALDDCANLTSDKIMTTGDALGEVAAALALAETQVYYQHEKSPEHEKHKKAIFSEDHTVIDTNAYTEKRRGFLSDPAVTELAKKYRDPAARKALFPDVVIPEKFEPKEVSAPQEQVDPQGPVDYRPDIRSLNIGKLQEELTEIRMNMQREQGEAAASI